MGVDAIHSQVFAVYLREIRILRHRLGKQLLSMSVTPLLYVITFGFGVGGAIKVHGLPYIIYLIPGIVAMDSMVHAYGISMEINISRFYWRTFDEILCSPVTPLSYTLGEALFGCTRVMISVALTLIIGALFGVFLRLGLWFWLGLLGNSLVFAFVALIVSMYVKNHADQAMINNFIITPMAFLSGTFFPVDKMPVAVQKLLMLAPLTHASELIRADAVGMPVELWRLPLLFAVAAVLFPLAVYSVGKARE